MDNHENDLTQSVALRHDPIEAGIVEPWLKKKCNLTGARILLYLLHYPDMPFNVLDLSDLVSGDGLLLDMGTGVCGRFVEEGIPLADNQYLTECRIEQVKLLKRIQGASELGDYKTMEKLTVEMGEINRIRGQIMTPYGKIRNTPGTADKEYKRLYNAYHYLLKLALREDPRVYECIKRHAVTGRWFMWQSCCPAPTMDTS
jgi:hypothetical protein